MLNTFYNLMEIAVNAVDLCILYYLIDGIFDRRKKYTYILLSVVVCVQAFAMYAANTALGNVGWLIFIVSATIISLGCIAFYKVNLIVFFLTLSLFFSYNLIVEFPVTIFYGYILNIPMVSLLVTPTIFRVSTIIITRSIIAFTAYKVKPYMAGADIRITKNKAYNLAVLLLLFFNVLFHYVVLDLQIGNTVRLLGDERVAFILMIMVAIITISSIIILRKIVDYTEKEIRWQTTKQEHEKTMQYLLSMIEFDSKYRSIKHDYTNHIIQISGYLNQNAFGEAIKYTNKLISDIADINMITAIENKVVGALLNFKKIMAEKEGIAFDFDIEIPENINIDNVDMTIIFGNIIDNAIEACCKCKPDHRSIKMTGRYCDGIITIYCENSTCDNIIFENGAIVSSKHDKTNHGYGINNVKRTVEEYDGTTDIECKEGIFSIEVNIKEKPQCL